METSSILGGIYKLMDWISKLALLNLLWIASTILGLGVFGFFPSTVAMFAVVRKWMLGEEEVSIVKTFWASYKKEFVKSNFLGVFIVAAGLVLYADLLFIQNAAKSMATFLYIPLFIITFIFVCTLFYLIPIFVHYEMKLTDVIKNSFFVMIMNPLSTLYMLIGSFGICFVLSYVPPICILFSGNLLAMLFMKPACNAFNKIQRKHEVFLQEQGI
ncbi:MULTISPECIES: YesL family protein [unclassified Bacillus (in: firmicutes)]|uniref:YesL family protein n=1 Tax=unclassified Bacillus (in: firmicutes) TaxID=185979 RepID=UPI001596CDE5|nr:MULTISPECIES: YesL family protein [unclassified Bacillus (in: firmicutes)]